MTATSRSTRLARLVFGSAMSALVVVAALSYRGMAASAESARRVGRTNLVLDRFEDFLLAMERVDASSRGFVLTGTPSYLAQFRVAAASAASTEATIRALTLDNLAQQGQLAALASLRVQKVERARAAMQRRDDQGLQPAAELIRSGLGQRLMEQLQEVARALESEELRLLALREADAHRRLDQTQTVLFVGAALGLVITAAGGLLALHRSAARRVSEDALQDSDDKYRALVEGIQDHAIYMLDPRGTIVTWNAGAERIKGYTAEQIIGRNFSCFFPPDDVERGLPDEVLRIAATTGRHEQQGMRVRRDGSRFLANVTSTALRDPAGQLRGFSEITRDLSESEALQVKYRGLLEAAPDAMVVVNQAGEIVLLNAQAESQFGYRRDELLGQPVKRIIPTGFAERLVADALRSVEDALAQQIGTGLELIGQRKTGSEFPIEIMLSPLKNADGILVTAAIRDITTRKKAEAHLQAEAQLQLKVAELNRSNEELGQFAYIASHDLQEPLRMVASYTQLLARRYKGKLDADADEFIAFAVDGATRMQRLIQDLLAYSRVETRPETVLDVSSEDALEQALLNLGGAIEDSGALVTHDRLPTVAADKAQLVQLFQNLIGNGIKYQRPGTPQIHLSAVNAAHRWVFAVRDNGLGIDAQYFERIFGMFQRLHKREEFAGTGIGLAICKKIVERHGGALRVESTLGHGSTFRFDLAESKSLS